MKNILKVLFAIFTIVALANIINLPDIGKPYLFQTQNEAFLYRLVPSKGDDIEKLEEKFSIFKNKDPKNSELILFRTFEKKWWKFWKWREYITNEKWQYPLLGD